MLFKISKLEERFTHFL